ncbi:MAG: tetratricopeptide repeat protein [Deferrisomatales bacterium]|nr:tetratricopeptide repeat protein [Deferrisomatales bacterium]
MGQLDLFLDAPVHLLAAMRLLERLDLEGCRRELALQRRVLPGADPDPSGLEGAASWLESRLPGPACSAPEYGAAGLLLCRELIAGHAEALRGLGEGTRRGVARTLAGWALGRARGEGLGERSEVVDGLPWAVFHLFAGRPGAALGPLLERALGGGGGSGAWLALGDALRAQGRREEALAAYREGAGLDPGLTAWRPAEPLVEELRRGFETDPLFGGSWWVVGAYLEGDLPRYRRAPPALRAARWQRFAALRADGAPAPVVFFGGLLLSEQGTSLPDEQLEAVRRVLQGLHPAAFALHRQALAEGGPPLPARPESGLP